jgi:hypothetical protein
MRGTLALPGRGGGQLTPRFYSRDLLTYASPKSLGSSCELSRVEEIGMRVFRKRIDKVIQYAIWGNCTQCLLKV